MSTSLHSIEGKYEIVNSEDKTVDYRDSQLIITRFYGGKERGICFQLTIRNGAFVTYVQLTAQQYYELVAEMNNH